MTTMTVAKATGYPARLVNNNFAVPLQTSAGVGFCIMSPGGLQVTNYINASADVSTIPPEALALQNGNFALIWHTSASLKFAIYNGAGALVTSAVTVSTIVSTSGMLPWHGSVDLLNDNFVLSWSTTGGAFQAQIYSNIGVAVGTTIAIASFIGIVHALASCANGDFVAYAFDTSANLHKLFRISNAGSVLWGPITPAGCAGAIFGLPDAPRQHPQGNRLVELIGGNIAICLPNTSNYANVFVLNSSGVLQQRVDWGNANHDAGTQAPLCWTPWGFAVAHGLSTSVDTYGSFFDGNGNCLVQNELIDEGGHPFPANSAPAVYFYMQFAGAGLTISRYAGLAGSVEHRLIHCDHLGNPLGTPFNPQPFGPSDMNAPWPCCDLDGMVFLCTFSVGVSTIVTTTVKIGRSSAIGVAQASATDGDAVTIVSEGYFQLPATQ